MSSRALLPATGAPLVLTRAVVACYLCRALIAFLATLPLAMALATCVGNYPEGDAVLWQSGSVMLVECGRQLQPLLPLVAWAGGGWLLLGALLWQFPLAMLIVSVNADADTALMPKAAPCFGRFVLLLGCTFLVQALLIVVGVRLGTFLAAHSEPGMSADLRRLASLSVAVLLVWTLAVLQDIARVHLVRGSASVWEALHRAMATLSRQPLRLLLAAAWRTLLILGVLLLTARWGGQRGAGSVAVAVAYQLALVIEVLVRLTWFRRISAEV